MVRSITKNGALEYIVSLYQKQEKNELDRVLEKVRNSVVEPELREIQISSVEGRMIYVLVQLLGVHSALEIGSFAGYSTLWIAYAMQSDAMLTSIEYDETRYNLAKRNIVQFDVSKRIQLIHNNALNYIRNVKKKDTIFDFVFIDGKKSEYPAYLEEVLPCIAKGGLIIADNTLMCNKSHSDDDVFTVRSGIDHFNGMIADSSLFTSTIIPTESGMTIAIKK